MKKGFLFIFIFIVFVTLVVFIYQTNFQTEKKFEMPVANDPYKHAEVTINGKVFDAYVSDTAGNINSNSSDFAVDLTYPQVSFNTDTPADASTQANTDIFVNLSSSDTGGDHYAFSDFDSSLVAWCRSHLDSVPRLDSRPWRRSSL